MRKTLRLILLPMLLLLVSVCPISALDLDAPLPRPIRAAGKPTDMLALLLAREIASVARIPMGFEESDEPPPSAPDSDTIAEQSALTIRQALNDLTSIDPRYEWRDVGGVVVIRPVSAWEGQRSPLNWPVGDVRWEAGSIRGALARLAVMFGYERDVQEQVHGTFVVDVRRGTMLDVMNATIRPDGRYAWFVYYRNSVAWTRTAGMAFALGLMRLELPGPTDEPHETTMFFAEPPRGAKGRESQR